MAYLNEVVFFPSIVTNQKSHKPQHLIGNNESNNRNKQ